MRIDPAHTFERLLRATACALLAALALGCASTAGPSRGAPQFDFFTASVPDDEQTDPWYPKVAEWQERMRAEGKRLPSTERSVRSGKQSGRLILAMSAFRDEERRKLAKQITDYSQWLARRYYKWDPASDDPVYDHWPTVGQLLGNNGDDCDGLDLIAYQLLREFGFPSNRVFRAITRRNRDGANHMVTLWFEDPADPWVLDPTGAVTFSMVRFSQLEGWTPTKIFNDSDQYIASSRGGARTLAAEQ